MRFFPLCTAFAICLVAAACTPADRATSMPADSPDDCRAHRRLITATDDGTPDSGVVLVLDAVARAQETDDRCGPPDDNIRICRALFVVATLDPALHLDDPSLRQQTGNALNWAIGDARSASPPDLVGVLDTLEQTTKVLATAADEQSVVNAVAQRADRDVTEVLDDHWLTNCR
ncbi:MAG: hypothetical protein HKN24_00345 [Acidimicrobiales bacterium]|nr:hypothetical protein [Acidimicrobiales bacterium]